ncbi:HPP family protein [Magnetospirillum sp. UT-4]|uniref:CBS domain-containing protein n=1 Tax=Magnetospirillum sp. UT-4 TaxID=2681467 RepID=UPI001384B98B|nr:CBS domain-containing protein [Magnetospirillum sp. UT-4]CAA7614171.1 CBS domain protein [Magnetospirillum sp. UT-4]
MSCHAIITPPPAILVKSATVAEAVATLAAHGFATLPVVDAKGHFAGVFGPKELIALMLPRAARLGEDLGDLAFVGEGQADLRTRLEALGKELVGKHLAPHRTVRGETPLVEALLLLYRGDAFLPVVDESGKLVGVVTAGSALAHVRGAA